MVRFLIPIGVFVVLVGFFWKGLGLNPRDLPSPLIDKPAPTFQLPQLHNTQQSFSPEEMKGKVWMLNVWASWCASCRYEHPLFLELARSGEVPIYGLNYKDAPADAKNWLNQLGDPYVLSVSDMAGDVGIDYGVYGVPETYIIDKQGVIRHKHTGPVDREALEKEILPLIRELKKG